MGFRAVAVFIFWTGRLRLRVFRAPEFDAETDMSVSVVESGFLGTSFGSGLGCTGCREFLAGCRYTQKVRKCL